MSSKPSNKGADNPRKAVELKMLLTLACGATVESALRECGITPRTVSRHLEKPAFCQRLQELRVEIVQRTAGALTAAGGEAVRTLLELLKPSVAPNTRLGAARAVLDSGVRLRENAELAARLTALEQQLGLAANG